MASLVWLSHSFQLLRRLLEDWLGSKLSVVMKLFLDLSLPLGAPWPERGCFGSVSCLNLWLLDLLSLRICGGAMPANLYSAGRGVGLSAPVIALHALLSSGSTIFAWHDLDQTGAQYSAVE